MTLRDKAEQAEHQQQDEARWLKVLENTQRAEKQHRERQEQLRVQVEQREAALLVRQE